MSDAERQRRRRQKRESESADRDRRERELHDQLAQLRAALGKNWKEQTRNLLALRDWIDFKTLFHAVEVSIGLHHAFRQAARDGNPTKGMLAARLRLFEIYLNKLEVEREPPTVDGKRYDYRFTKVRLPRDARQRQKLDRFS